MKDPSHVDLMGSVQKRSRAHRPDVRIDHARCPTISFQFLNHNYTINTAFIVQTCIMRTTSDIYGASCLRLIFYWYRSGPVRGSECTSLGPVPGQQLILWISCKSRLK